MAAKTIFCLYHGSARGCPNGRSCKYSHKNPNSVALCRYYVNGNCKYGKKCKYRHSGQKAPKLKQKKGYNPVSTNNTPQIIIIPVQTPQSAATPTQIQNTNQVNITQPQNINNDNATCIYICAVVGLFIPIVGLIAMCYYHCGTGLAPNQAKAFKILCLLTIIGLIWNVVIGWESD